MIYENRKVYAWSDKDTENLTDAWVTWKGGATAFNLAFARQYKCSPSFINRKRSALKLVVRTMRASGLAGYKTEELITELTRRGTVLTILEHEATS